MTTLSPKASKLLEWLRAIDELIVARLVTLEEHPTVRERTEPQIPATAVVLTKDGQT